MEVDVNKEITTKSQLVAQQMYFSSITPNVTNKKKSDNEKIEIFGTICFDKAFSRQCKRSLW